MPSSQALLKATSAGRPRQVRLLLDSGTSIEEVDNHGQTPLIKAVFVENDNSRQKILRLLLKYGATVSKADVVGRNALAWSCIYGRDDDVAILLENADVDLDVNQTDINGQTALYHAVSSGNASCVKTMVEALQKYGLSVDIADYNGYSPLMNALRLGFDVCASILIRNGKAKVGLGMKYPKDFAQVEKWATHSLRDREIERVNKKSSFLPLLVQKPLQQIQIYDQTMVNSRPRKCSDSSENDSFEESDYCIPSDNSTVYSRNSHHNVDTFIDYLPVAMDTLRPPPSKTVSVTSSTLVHPSRCL